LGNELIHILGLVAAVLGGLIALRFLLRYPEIALALFVAVYVLKGGINVGPLNLTAMMLIISILGFVLPVIAGKTRVQFQITWADIWLWLFMIVWIGGLLYSPRSAFGIGRTFRIFAITITPYFLARVFLTQPQQVKRFLLTLFLSAVVVSLILAVGAGVAHSHNGRMIFLEANPIPEASLLAMGFLIAVIGVAEGLFQKRWARWLSVGSAPVLIYGIFLTGSRGPLVSSAVAVAFYLAVIFRKRAGNVLAVGLALMILGIGVVNFGIIPHSFATRYNPLTWRASMSVRERFALYQSIWWETQQQPLLGLGTGSVSLAENIFLEVYANVGLIGLLCFLAFLYSIARHGVRYLVRAYPCENTMVRGIGLLVIIVAVALFMDKQVSYALDGDKDLFIFLGLVVNLPYIVHLHVYSTDKKRGAG